MFRRCLSLNSLPDISKWNTNNAAHIYAMFGECPNIIFSKLIKAKFKL